jgi:hypothetical protein
VVCFVLHGLVWCGVWYVECVVSGVVCDVCCAVWFGLECVVVGVVCCVLCVVL